MKGNTLHFLGKEFNCAIGTNGTVQPSDKKEGDGKTPTGHYSLVEVWYRSDRTTVETLLPLREINKNDGWCDDPNDKNYNKHVKLPYPASHEELYLSTAVYDILAVINYNYPETTPGHGSAIFFHVASQTEEEILLPTAGCIALKYEDLKFVLKNFLPTSSFIIAL